jgi:hypothetical protein
VILGTLFTMKLHSHSSAPRSRIVPLAHWQDLQKYENHRVPLDALILDAKYCELCGRNFLGRKQSRDRYCSGCLLAFLTSNREEDAKLPSNLVH